jgi:hypothetical protein
MVAPDLRHPRRSQAEIPLIDLSEFGQPPLDLGTGPSSSELHNPRFGDEREYNTKAKRFVQRKTSRGAILQSRAVYNRRSITSE